jgi:hypothetical protein
LTAARNELGEIATPMASSFSSFMFPQNAPIAFHSPKAQYILILKGFAPQAIPFFISSAVFHPGGGAK